MDQQSVQVIIETLKEEGVDLAVTLPEEPTFSLTEAMREDPFFQAVTVAGEGNGLAFCAGAALGGRRVVFVTGIAGLLVGDRKSTRLNSSHRCISYAVFCLKKKK